MGGGGGGWWLYAHVEVLYTWLVGDGFFSLCAAGGGLCTAGGRWFYILCMWLVGDGFRACKNHEYAKHRATNVGAGHIL